jgi:hypothetical protein
VGTGPPGQVRLPILCRGTLCETAHILLRVPLKAKT